MASATPAQLRAGIATYLQGKITGLRSIADGETLPSPPVAIILPATGKYIDYLVAFGAQGSGFNWSSRILILISKGHVRAQTVALDGYLATHGPTSIPAALAADPTCGGVADFVIPVEASWLGRIEWAGLEYMAGQIALEVGAE